MSLAGISRALRDTRDTTAPIAALSVPPFDICIDSSQSSTFIIACNWRDHPSSSSHEVTHSMVMRSVEATLMQISLS